MRHCTGTTPGYNVNEYVNGAIDDGATVNAGDVIVVSMSQTATTEQVLVKDGSRSWPASYVSNDDTAIDFGVFHECFPAGPPCPAIKFGTANFSAVRVNTAKLSRPPHAKYNLTSPATGHTLVATSKIGSSGDDFTLTFMNATRPRSHT